MLIPPVEGSALCVVTFSFNAFWNLCPSELTSNLSALLTVHFVDSFRLFPNYRCMGAKSARMIFDHNYSGRSSPTLAS